MEHHHDDLHFRKFIFYSLQKFKNNKGEDIYHIIDVEDFLKVFFLLIYGTQSGDRTYDKILLVIGDPDADTIDGETIWDDHYGDNALDVPLFWFRFPASLSAHLRNVHLFSVFCSLHCLLLLKWQKLIYLRYSITMVAFLKYFTV